MSESFSIKIKSHVGDVDRAVDAKIRLALDVMGDTVTGYAQDDCPVDTGNLRNSLSHAGRENEEMVGTNVEYAPYVEFIDRYHHDVGKAHFLRDAAENHVDELKNKAEVILAAL